MLAVIWSPAISKSVIEWPVTNRYIATRILIAAFTSSSEEMGALCASSLRH